MVAPEILNPVINSKADFPTTMHWTHLTTEDQLNDLIASSHDKPKVIFKHSTRCSISRTALNRVEKLNNVEGVDFYFLDLLVHRPVSNKVAEVFNVHHESPQVLLIRSGECIYEESHLGISTDEILEQARAN